MSMVQPQRNVPTLALRQHEIAAALGISLRSLQNMLKRREFPPADRHCNTLPLWSVETVRDWIASGGRDAAGDQAPRAMLQDR